MKVTATASPQVTQVQGGIVSQYRASKITVFVWGKNAMVKLVGNTEYSQ